MGIFDQIKSAFSKTDQQPVRREVKPEARPEPAPEPPAQATPAIEARIHTVQSGDTLWKIAQETLGEGERYPEIFEANRDILESPDHILPGQELKIP